MALDIDNLSLSGLLQNKLAGEYATHIIFELILIAHSHDETFY